MKTCDSWNRTREAVLVFLMVLVAYGYFSTERDANINSRLALVKAFVDEGRFEIDSYHNTELYTVDKSYFNDHYYSDKAIGTAVLGVAAYYPIRSIYAREEVRLTPRLFREWLTFLVVSLPTAFIAPFLYLLIKQLVDQGNRALILTLAICLGTPLFKYATAFYGHTLAAAFYFLSFLIWFSARRRRSISLPWALLSTFLLGVSFITEYPAIILVLCLLIYMLITLHQSGQLKNWPMLTAMIVAFIVPISLQLYYNQTIFGTPWTTGYSHEANEAFKIAHASNFMGVGMPDLRIFFYQTFHPSIGIFWLSPMLLLAIAGWFQLVKAGEYRTELIFSAGTIIIYILFFSGYYTWWGGNSFTPRHIIPILPLFSIPLILIPKKLAIPLWIASLISIFQNLIMAASGFDGLSQYYETLLEGRFIAISQPMLVYKVCLANLINGLLMNNRGIQLLGLQGPASLSPLFILEFVLLALFFTLSPRNSKKENSQSNDDLLDQSK